MGVPDNLRGRVDDTLRELNKQVGVDRIRLMVEGCEVGTMTLNI